MVSITVQIIQTAILIDLSSVRNSSMSDIVAKRSRGCHSDRRSAGGVDSLCGGTYGDWGSVSVTFSARFGEQELLWIWVGRADLSRGVSGPVLFVEAGWRVESLVCVRLNWWVYAEVGIDGLRQHYGGGVLTNS